MSVFDYSKFLDLAKSLQGFQTEEENRSGISRCYYSVFSKAKIFCGIHKLLTTSQLRNTTGSVHAMIIEKLKDSEDEEIFKIGSMIDTLRARRNEADYNSYCDDSGTNRFLLDTIEMTIELKKYISDYK